MNYEDMTGEQVLDKIEEMFPLFERLEREESTNERDQNDLKAVMLSILDSIPHAVIGLRDRKIIFANDAVELVFGWKIEELIGKPTRVLYRSDEEYEEIASYAYPALEKRRTYSREFHCRHKDGRDIVCLVSSSRVGEILKDRMIVVTYSDITDRKRAEYALRRHEADLEQLVEARTTELKKTASLLQQEVVERKDGEERLRNARARLLTVLDGLNASVYVVDMNTYEVLYINKHMKDLFGDVTGKICWQSILNQQGPCDFCVEERLRTPEAGSSDVHIWEQYHDGLGVWILIQDQVIQWMDGRMVRLKIATDISKRKLAEQAVNKIQIQQKAILDNIPDMAWLKDRDSRYIAVNEAFGNACGVKPEDVEGLIDTDIWPAELAERYREDDKKVIDCGTRKRVEEPLVEKDGREIWIETIKTPIFNDENEIIGTAGIARDITRRKNAEEEVKRRERELEANARNLEEVNIALKVLLKRREEDKSELEEKVLSNVKALIEPYFDKLKRTRLSSDQMTYVNIIETHLSDIISPFLRELTSKYLNLTPREIQIANLIKEGKTTKEIAELLNSSQGAVDFHRNNIRNKLHLKNKKTNLRSYLLSLS